MGLWGIWASGVSTQTGPGLHDPPRQHELKSTCIHGNKYDFFFFFYLLNSPRALLTHSGSVWQKRGSG